MKKIADVVAEISGQTVIVRANFDVPIEDGRVVDTTRIEDAISTIKLLRQHQCRVVLLAHYDRPDGIYAQEKSLKPIVPVLESLIDEQVELAPFVWEYPKLQLPEADIVLVDNLRFYPQEEANDPDFARHLASFGQVYVNQAFANCHREHASMVGIPDYLPAYAGVDLANEIEILERITKNPDKPLIVVIGGAKLETKVPLVKVFAPVADKILVGGKIAAEIRESDMSLPENVIVADLIENQRDITQESADQFAQIIAGANTLMWNGTMGVFEESQHQKGTRIVAQAVNDSPAYTVIGGGDTETALTQLDLESGIDFISTGGGAMLTFLSEGSLPGLDKLK